MRKALEPTNDHILNNEAAYKIFSGYEIPLFNGQEQTSSVGVIFLLSVAKMHRLYVEKYEGVINSVVKYRYYNKVFNENLNLSFRFPKTDTCGTCEEFMVKLSAEKLATQEMHERVLLKTFTQVFDLTLKWPNRICSNCGCMCLVFIHVVTMMLQCTAGQK